MTRLRITRISGVSLLAGAVAFTVHLVARSMITAGADPVVYATTSVWALVNLLGALGAALVLLGFPGLYAKLAGASGGSGLAGVVLLALAWMFFGLFLSFYAALVMPWLAGEAPALITASAPLPMGILIAFVIGLVAEVIGTIFLAIPFMRGRVQPIWVGYLLLSAAVMRVAGNFIAPSGPASNLAINLLSNLGPVLFLIAVGYLGFHLWTDNAPSAQVSLREHPSLG